MKSNKGITLVALIITVIILLILSAISIDIAIDGKLFDRSKETVSEANNKLGEEQNRVDSLVNEWDNLETGTSGNTSGNEPEDTTPPTVEVEIERTTSNSITINVTATDNESGMIETPTYTYYIKKSTESIYEEKASNNTSSHIFTDLTQETTYDIKVEVAGDNAGNTGTGTAQATTRKVTSGLEQGAITFGSTTWSNNQASVTVNTNTSYTIEYQVNSIDGAWTTIENRGTVSGLNHGDTVYARLTDGINAGQHASASIIDGIAPTINSFTVTSANTTSIAVSTTAIDNESGIYSYTFQYKTSTASDYTTAKTTITTNGTCTYTYTGLADNTTYNLRVIVTDKANKTSNRETTQTTVNANVAPVIATAAYNSKTTNSITVTAKATDANGDNLTYTLYTSTSQNGSYTKKATTSASQNTTVTLSATSLSNYTTYWWYVTASDGEATATSNKQSTRTYCPGTGLTCTTSTCPGTQTITCTTCNGNKTVMKTCNDFSNECTNCKGIGHVCPICSGAYTYVHSDYRARCDCGGKVIGDYYACWNCEIGLVITTCTSCNETTFFPSDEAYYPVICSKCEGTGSTCTHGYTKTHTYTETCSDCNGTGTISTTPCIHGYSSSHRYCSHYTTTTLTSHSYCSHGYLSQHD